MPTHDFNLQGPKHLNNVEWENHAHQRIVAACLVNAAYVLEGDRREGRSGEDQLARPWWEFFGFELVYSLKSRESPLSSFIIGAVFRLKEASRTSTVAPAMVIAVRGKLDHHDWGVSADTFLGLGHKRHTFRIVMDEAESLVCHHGMESNLWLCGHSLGATVATFVGEQMAKRGCFFRTFLFNPPYILNRRLKDGFLCQLDDIMEAIGNLIGGVIAGGMFGHVVVDLAAIALRLRDMDKQSDNEIAGDPAAVATNLLQHFDNLNKWDPHVYVNPKDRLCRRYIKYFEKKMKGSPEQLPKRIASATLVINLVEPGHERLHCMQCLVKPEDAYQPFKEAHSIMQWWKPGLRVEAKRYVMV